MKNRIKTYSIKVRQQSAFDAAVENTKQANEAIRSAQNWLNVLALAELTFLGSILVQVQSLSSCLVLIIKVMIVLLLLSLLLFLIGALTQYRHLLSIARTFFGVSNRAYEYLKNGSDEVDSLPSDLNFPDSKQLKSNKLANQLFASSFFIVVFVSIGISVLIFFI